MKVVQINEVCGRGSTGLICLDIAIASNQQGIQNYVYYGQKNSGYPYSKKFGGRLGNILHSVFFTRLLGIHGYGSYLNTVCLIQELKKLNPDLIHLHSLHTNYINYPLLYRYIIKREIPVVMTLHDCYNFTGQCEHFAGAKCERFTNGCGECPILHKTIAPSLIFDRSRWLITEKKKWYSKISKMTIVGVSKWIKQEADKSILAINNHKVTYIYNWIDTDIFYPRSQYDISQVRKKYNINNNYSYVIAVAAAWDIRTTKYWDIVEFSKRLPSNIKLIVVGSLRESTAFPDSIIHIGFTENMEDLACLYSLASAYFHVSISESFGKVIAEAMACGTMPIVYKSTACPEIAAGFGVSIPPHDILAAIKALNRRLSDEETIQMIDYVKKTFNKEKNINSYIQIYRDYSKK